MHQPKIKFVFLFIFIFAGLNIVLGLSSAPIALAQQPTGSVPTVTSTVVGMIVQVRIDQTNEIVTVYAGPNETYPSVGVILMGQEIPVTGISQDGQWLQIYYPGIPESTAWVYGIYVEVIKNAKLPVLPPPNTPTALATTTINPTLVAAFIPQVTQTRLPTFTPAPEVIVATFLPEGEVNRVPTGLLILALGFIGGFGVLISFLRGR